MSNLIPSEIATVALINQNKIVNAKTPARSIRKVSKGNKGTFTYVNALDAMKILEKHYTILSIVENYESIREDNNWVHASLTLEVLTPEGLPRKVTRFGSIEKVKSGDRVIISPIKMVFQDALKRCCVALGLFRDVYGTVDFEDTQPSFEELPSMENQRMFIDEFLPLLRGREGYTIANLMNTIELFIKKEQTVQQLIKIFKG